ncbi:MAG: hypothetical protein ACPHID_05205 [Thermoplasmatota archaeon]
MNTWRRWQERLALAVHALHGSRGVYLGALGFLIITWAEPAIDPDVDRLFLTLPVFVIFVNGLVTLPREGVAARQRALALLDGEQDWRPMARRLFWPALLTLLLAPRIFLAGYGIPHMNPLTGLLTPAIQRQLTVTFLFLLLLIPAWYLRSSRRYAPIEPQRPKDLAEDDQLHGQRDLLLWMSLAIGAAWAWLLAPFWTPFSLLEWTPHLDSLRQGASGLGSISFALTIPLVLWMSLHAHLAFLFALWRRDAFATQRRQAALAVAHIALVLLAVALHVYDLLWIAQYRSAVGF